MLSTMSASTATMLAQDPVHDAIAGDLDDMADTRSSSLSELGDASDDQSEPTPRPILATDLEENDSEAETERLDKTPRKLTRTGTDTSLLSESLYTRTPSKLAYTATIENEGSAPGTPSIVLDDVTAGEVVEVETPENPLLSLSLAAASKTASLEYMGKKRKRGSAEGTPVDEQDEDEPAPKRSASIKTPNGQVDSVADSLVDSAAHVDMDEELDNAEERLSQLAQEELELEEAQANIAAETVNELAIVAKNTKPRKGGRRGKRKIEDPNFAQGEPFGIADGQEAEGEVEGDEEDNAVLDEEIAKKKAAIDELAKIEQKFKVFREK